jgi:hypothetical protein
MGKSSPRLIFVMRSTCLVIRKNAALNRRNAGKQRSAMLLSNPKNNTYSAYY